MYALMLKDRNGYIGERSIDCATLVQAQKIVRLIKWVEQGDLGMAYTITRNEVKIAEGTL